jgi:hypothetical protein
MVRAVALGMFRQKLSDYLPSWKVWGKIDILAESLDFMISKDLSDSHISLVAPKDRGSHRLQMNIWDS